MTKRILGLLWRTSLASTVPSGLDMTLCFADVLRDYALTSRNSDTRDIALDYVSQLVQELSGTDKALPALRVLSHLVAPSNNHTVSHCAVLLLSSYTVLTNSACQGSIDVQYACHLHICGCPVDPGFHLFRSASDRIRIVVLLQAPILTVLKRYGDMLQIVLGSLQVAVGLASLHCIAFLVQLKHRILSVSHAAWYSMAQHSKVQSSVCPSLGHSVLPEHPQFRLYEQCYHHLLSTAICLVLDKRLSFKLSPFCSVVNCTRVFVTLTRLATKPIMYCRGSWGYHCS